MGMRQEQQGRFIGPFGAARARPLLFITTAAILFAGALFLTRELTAPPTVETRIRTEIVALDLEATATDSLVSPKQITSDGLRELISDPLASYGETVGTAVDVDGLEIVDGEMRGDFILSFGEDREAGLDERLNAVTSMIVDALNRQREQQRAEVTAWIERTATRWQARIDEAKAAIVKNPFNPDISEDGERLQDEKLLRLMIDAQTKARDNDVDLTSDVARLQDVLAELEAGRAAQWKHGTALRDAEAGLARHEEAADRLTGEGAILDRPAAIVVETASASTAGLTYSFQSLGSGVIVSTLALIGLVLALVVTMIACWFAPREEAATNDYLNDPNWPLPREARKQFST